MAGICMSVLVLAISRLGGALLRRRRGVWGPRPGDGRSNLARGPPSTEFDSEN